MKKLLFKFSNGQVYSHSVNSFIGVRFLSGGSTLAIFLFNSDDNTEIHSYSIEIQLNKDLEFLRDLQDNLSFSKKSSVVIYDASTDYSLSSYAVTSGNVVREVIRSPVVLNGNLNLTEGDTDYNVTAGNITAVGSLISDGDVTFGGSLVDSSSPNPTVATTGSGETVAISGKDSAGAVTFTTEAASGSLITVTYGTAAAGTVTRIPVITFFGGIETDAVSYDNNGFSVRVRVGSTVAIGSLFTYITQDHA